MKLSEAEMMSMDVRVFCFICHAFACALRDDILASAQHHVDQSLQDPYAEDMWASGICRIMRELVDGPTHDAWAQAAIDILQPSAKPTTWWSGAQWQSAIRCCGSFRKQLLARNHHHTMQASFCCRQKAAALQGLRLTHTAFSAVCCLLFCLGEPLGGSALRSASM